MEYYPIFPWELPFPDAEAGKDDSVCDTPADIEDIMPSDTSVTEKIRLAKKYLSALHSSKDPITEEELDIPLLKREDVSMALSIALELISDIENKKTDTKPTVVYEKRAFTPSAVDRGAVGISEKPIRINGFLSRINKRITDKGVRNLGLAQVMRWLGAKGFVKEERVKVVKEEKVYLATDSSIGVGILTLDSVDEKTGEVKSSLLLSAEAQRMILDSLEEIIEA